MEQDIITLDQLLYNSTDNQLFGFIIIPSSRIFWTGLSFTSHQHHHPNIEHQ